MNVMTMTDTSLMKAAIVTGPGAMVTEARPLPQPGQRPSWCAPLKKRLYRGGWEQKMRGRRRRRAVPAVR